MPDDARVEQGSRLVGIFLAEIGADQLCASATRREAPAEQLSGVLVALEKDLLHVAVTAAENAQQPCVLDRQFILRQAEDPPDDALGPGLTPLQGIRRVAG